MTEVLTTDEARVRWITLNRPETRNALTTQVNDAVRRAIDSAPGAGARVVVLTGAGGAFSSGLRRRLRISPVTRAWRRPVIVLLWTQPVAPSTSRIFRQYSYCSITSTGRLRRVNTHSMGYCTPGPVRTFTSSAFRLT